MKKVLFLICLFFPYVSVASDNNSRAHVIAFMRQPNQRLLTYALKSKVNSLVDEFPCDDQQKREVLSGIDEWQKKYFNAAKPVKVAYDLYATHQQIVLDEGRVDWSGDEELHEYVKKECAQMREITNHLMNKNLEAAAKAQRRKAAEKAKKSNVLAFLPSIVCGSKEKAKRRILPEVLRYQVKNTPAETRQQDHRSFFNKVHALERDLFLETDSLPSCRSRFQKLREEFDAGALNLSRRGKNLVIPIFSSIDSYFKKEK